MIVLGIISIKKTKVKVNFRRFLKPIPPDDKKKVHDTKLYKS